jgi:hypothetical protein
MAMHVESRKNLTLSDIELRAVVAAISQQENVLANLAKRTSRRFALLGGHHVILGYNPPGGTSVTFAPVVRDVSRGGLSALHSVYLHVSTRVACLFVGPDRSSGLRVAGEIVRCRHIRGTVHEVGVKFSQPAAIYPFVRLENDDPGYRSTSPYPAIEMAQRQFDEMMRDGAPLAMLREGLNDIDLALSAEEAAQNQVLDPNTKSISCEEIDRRSEPKIEQTKPAQLGMDVQAA